jgi:hypothetical protein
MQVLLTNELLLTTFPDMDKEESNLHPEGGSVAGTRTEKTHARRRSMKVLSRVKK